MDEGEPTREELRRQALRRGFERADEILDQRQAVLAARAEAIGLTARRAPTPALPEEELERAFAAAGGEAGSAGLIIAEGDSWFDYPGVDILNLLEDKHGFDVESVAHRGDTIEDMAYSGGQLEEFTRRIEKAVRARRIPSAILLSGGGNDIAGSEFRMLLDHSLSPLPGLNQQVLDGIIWQRLLFAYTTILGEITQVCLKLIGRKIPIIVHGYDYPVPDGRGFFGGWWILPGPWLSPGFSSKGFSEMGPRLAMSQDLIDRFNEMLERLITYPEFSHCYHVDLRGMLPTDLENYRTSWANELHPTNVGFELITAAIAERIHEAQDT